MSVWGGVVEITHIPKYAGNLVVHTCSEDDKDFHCAMLSEGIKCPAVKPFNFAYSLICNCFFYLQWNNYHGHFNLHKKVPNGLVIGALPREIGVQIPDSDQERRGTWSWATHDFCPHCHHLLLDVNRIAVPFFPALGLRSKRGFMTKDP